MMQPARLRKTCMDFLGQNHKSSTQKIENFQFCIERMNFRICDGLLVYLYIIKFLKYFLI